MEKLKETDPLDYINVLLKLLKYDTFKLSITTIKNKQIMEFEPFKIIMNSPKPDYLDLSLEG